MARWTTSDIASLGGRSFVVTGPGGLGFETGLALARAGGAVILAGRDPTKGEASRDAIRAQAGEADVRFERLDLASLASIRAFAERLAGQRESLDVLVNNAGVMALPQRRITADGFEMQLGTNHLGHFALTGLLLPLLRRGSSPRVVTVSSLAHRNGRIAFDDLQSERRYSGWRAYGQSKLANLLFARELQRRSDEEDWGIASIAAHPGASSTDLMDNGPGRRSIAGRLARLFAPLVFQSAARGALPQLYAATSPDAVPGGYYGPDGFSEMKGEPAAARRTMAARDDAVAARLWAVSEELTGVRY
ncbi:MAG: SDR family oxidoreductase [Sphingomonadaceae bacterium]|nr:SDR family oxidoreductase [Sphingomonadaceae bacterium]